MSVNKVILVGNLGKDPEMRSATNGTSIANFSIATSEVYRNRDTNEKTTRTEWHRVVMFSRLAEIAQQYLKKGSKIYVEGKLRTNKWTDKNGNERYTTEVVADQMQMLGSTPQSGGSQYNSNQNAQNPTNNEVEHFDHTDSDIPF